MDRKWRMWRMITWITTAGAALCGITGGLTFLVCGWDEQWLPVSGLAMFFAYVMSDAAGLAADEWRLALAGEPGERGE